MQMENVSVAMKVNESEKPFWKNIYQKDKAHWIDKKPSQLTRRAITKYGGNWNKILEIGCGAGIDTFLLATAVKEKVIGIDITEDAIKIAKENLKQQSKEIQNKVIFETGDAEKLKYKDGEFDFVYSLSVLHSTDVSKSLKEIARVITDNGTAVLYVFIGSKKEEVSDKEFLDTCEKYFQVEEKSKIVIKDAAKDKHLARIVFLRRKRMPYSSLSAASKAGAITTFRKSPMSLEAVNKLYSVYDALKADTKVANPMAVAMATWKGAVELKNGVWLLKAAPKKESKKRSKTEAIGGYPEKNVATSLPMPAGSLKMGDGSMESFKAMLRDALQTLYGKQSVYIIGTYRTKVVIEVYADNKETYYELPYTIKNGGFDFGTPVKVKKLTTYQKAEQKRLKKEVLRS